MPKPRPTLFKWRHFEPEIIICAVRWYLRLSLSYRDVEELLVERGLPADHTTIWRWVQRGGTGLFASMHSTCCGWTAATCGTGPSWSRRGSFGSCCRATRERPCTCGFCGGDLGGGSQSAAQAAAHSASDLGADSARVAGMPDRRTNCTAVCATAEALSQAHFR
jgi:hypothetical protein